MHRLAAAFVRSARGWAPASVEPLWRRVQASPIGRRLAHGAFWSFFGAVGSKALALAAAIVVARLLGTTQYGEFGLLVNTLGTYAALASFGMGVTAAKFVAECRQTDPARAGVIIGISSATAWVTGLAAVALMNVYAPWIAATVLKAPHLTLVVRLGSVILLTMAIASAQTGALNGFEAFKASANRNILVGLATFPLMVGGAWFGGLTGAIGGMLVSQLLSLWLNDRLLRAETGRFGVVRTLRGARRELPVLWRFSVPAVISSSLVLPVTWCCQMMIFSQANGKSEFAAYTAAYNWNSAIQFLPAILAQPLMPILAERLGVGEIGRSLRAVRAVILLNLAVVTPIILIGALLSPWIMRLYGPQYTAHWSTLVWVLLTSGLLAIETPVGQIITAGGKMWCSFLMNLGWAVVLVGTTYALASHGALGLAGAMFVAYLVHGVWTFGYLWVLLRHARGREGGEAGGWR